MAHGYFDNPYLSLGQPRQPSALPVMQPEEEESTLDKLLGAAGTGLGYVSDTIGKPGRAFRGLIGGNPREMLNLLPIPTDTLGITDPHQQTTGRNLLEQWGAVDKGVPGSGLDAGDVAGFGVDVLTDPLTYFTGGMSALTAEGKAAQKAGTLAKTLGERVGFHNPITGLHEPQAGLARFHIPFTGVEHVMGTGPTGQKIAEGVSKYADKALYSGPGRVASALFDSRVAGPGGNAAWTEPLQRAARAAADETEQLKNTWRTRAYNATRTLAENDLLDSDTIRGAMEGTQMGPLHPVMEQVLPELKAINEEMLQGRLERGVKIGEEPNYALRQRTKLPTEGPDAGGLGARPRNPMNPWDPSMRKRQDVFNIPGKTLRVNDLFTPELLDLARTDLKAAGREVFSKTYGDVPSALEELHNLNVSAKAGEATEQELARLKELKGQFRRTQKLADVVRTADPRFATEGVDYFGNHTINDLLTGIDRGSRTIGKAEAALSALAQNVGAPSVGSQPLGKVLGDMGLKTSTALQNIGERLGQAGHPAFPGGMTPEEVIKAAKGLHVPAELAADLGRYVQGFTKPEAIAPLLDAFDSITKLTKAGQTGFTPGIGVAYHARNLMQDLWNKFVHGAESPLFNKLDPRAWVNPILDAHKVFREGGELPAEVVSHLSQVHLGIFPAGISGDEAAKKVADLAAALGVTKPGQSMAHDLTGFRDLKNFPVPGAPQESALDILKGAVPKTLEEAKPWALGGVKTGIVKGPMRQATTYAPARAGGKLLEMNDQVTRGSTFLSKLMQGFAPEEAAKEVARAHYNFNDLTQTERSVLTRVVPFYRWMRQNLPAQMQQLLEKPGGATAQAVHATERASQKEGFQPEYLGEGAAIPLGKEDDGTMRYLTRLGLPFEDLGQFIRPGPHGIQRSAQALLGQTNPLIKGALEAATGKQFYSGRDLADLYSRSGSSAADQFIMNSPLSRLLTTGGLLADPRKGLSSKLLNTATGFKVSDVDMEKQKAVAARQLIDDFLRGQPEINRFERLYPKQGAQLTPQETELLRLQKTLEAQSQKKAKENRNAAAAR